MRSVVLRLFVIFRIFIFFLWTDVKTGTLIQVPEGKRRFRRRLSTFKSDREAVRQCFLFSHYIIIATR